MFILDKIKDFTMSSKSHLPRPPELFKDDAQTRQTYPERQTAWMRYRCLLLYTSVNTGNSQLALGNEEPLTLFRS